MESEQNILNEQLETAINNGDDAAVLNLLQQGALPPLKSDRLAFWQLKLWERSGLYDLNFFFLPIAKALYYTLIASCIFVFCNCNPLYIHPILLTKLNILFNLKGTLWSAVAFGFDVLYLCIAFIFGRKINNFINLSEETIKSNPRFPNIIRLAIEKGNIKLAYKLAYDHECPYIISVPNYWIVLRLSDVSYMLSKLNSFSKLKDVHSRQDKVISIFVDGILNWYQRSPSFNPQEYLNEKKVQLEEELLEAPKISFWRKLIGLDSQDEAVLDHVSNLEYKLVLVINSLELLNNHNEFKLAEQATKRCILSKTALKSMRAYKDLGGDIEKKILTFAFPEHNDESLKECFLAAKQGTNWQVLKEDDSASANGARQSL